MSHYFDDILTREIKRRDSTTPTTPGPNGKPRMRRSSTARSIGARSDFDSEMNGQDGHDDSLGNSVTLEDPDRLRERLREKSEADAHMHRYISDQLERFKEDKEYVNGGDNEYEATA